MRIVATRRSLDVTTGFTLIEVLVALTILSLSLAMIMALFSTGLRGRRAAQNYNQATLLAQSKLASIGIDQPLQPGLRRGYFENGFRWNVSVTPYREEGRGDADRLAQPVEVTVEVSWGDPNNEQSVSLTTLRLIP